MPSLKLFRICGIPLCKCRADYSGITPLACSTTVVRVADAALVVADYDVATEDENVDVAVDVAIAGTAVIKFSYKPNGPPNLTLTQTLKEPQKVASYGLQLFYACAVRSVCNVIRKNRSSKFSFTVSTADERCSSP